VKILVSINFNLFSKIVAELELEALAKRGSNFYRNNLGQLNIIDASTISMALGGSNSICMLKSFMDTVRMLLNHRYLLL